MTKARKKEAYELTGKKLEAYREGFWGGNESNYFPGGLDEFHYDWGYEDGQKYGPRKGKPWTLRELMALAAKMKGKKR